MNAPHNRLTPEEQEQPEQKTTIKYTDVDGDKDRQERDRQEAIKIVTQHLQTSHSFVFVFMEPNEQTPKDGTYSFGTCAHVPEGGMRGMLQKAINTLDDLKDVGLDHP